MIRSGFNHNNNMWEFMSPRLLIAFLLLALPFLATCPAALADGEDVAAATKKLQAQAEGLVEDHKQGMLKSIEELYQLSERQAEIRGLQQQLERAQQRLTEIRKEHPALEQIEGGEV
jgi:predicted small secreted protein